MEFIGWKGNVMKNMTGQCKPNDNCIRQKQIDIGELIRKELVRQERTPTWLARKINCQRPNIYYIFNQTSINTQLLEAISRALNHNFFKYFDDDYILKESND